MGGLGFGVNCKNEREDNWIVVKNYFWGGRGIGGGWDDWRIRSNVERSWGKLKK